MDKLFLLNESEIDEVGGGCQCAGKMCTVLVDDLTCCTVTAILAVAVIVGMVVFVVVPIDECVKEDDGPDSTAKKVGVCVRKTVGDLVAAPLVGITDFFRGVFGF